ncbi:MAG: hypothetical protein QOE65_412 [Solirubrobacteraceae bacterium]|jgi:hypothetical protein|nr:hypothetical protein [Solirubrobacteraceae bacterium]
MTYEHFAPILHALGMAQAKKEMLDLASMAAELDLSETELEMRLQEIDARGLAFSGLEFEGPPMLLNAGRQYLALEGRVASEALDFLPRQIDDLHARQAMLHAGTVLVDEFRVAVLQGRGVAHAQELVPEGFVEAIDESRALDLFSAAVALMARLSAEEPAGCVAEEVLAVTLIGGAQAWLETQAEAGHLDAEAATSAAGEVHGGLFDFFQDDDVLDMFQMREPSDASVALGSPRNQQLGIADQRIEEWFKPFGGVAPTGYLRA